MEQKIYLTERKQYTPTEVIDYFSGKISNANIGILVDHLTMDISGDVVSVTEQDGILFLNLGDGFFSVSRKS